MPEEGLEPPDTRIVIASRLLEFGSAKRILSFFLSSGRPLLNMAHTEFHLAGVARDVHGQR
jgi:hypothetical protein